MVRTLLVLLILPLGAAADQAALEAQLLSLSARFDRPPTASTTAFQKALDAIEEFEGQPLDERLRAYAVDGPPVEVAPLCLFLVPEATRVHGLKEDGCAFVSMDEQAVELLLAAVELPVGPSPMGIHSTWSAERQGRSAFPNMLALTLAAVTNFKAEIAARNEQWDYAFAYWNAAAALGEAIAQDLLVEVIIGTVIEVQTWTAIVRNLPELAEDPARLREVRRLAARFAAYPSPRVWAQGEVIYGLSDLLTALGSKVPLPVVIPAMFGERWQVAPVGRRFVLGAYIPAWSSYNTALLAAAEMPWPARFTALQELRKLEMPPTHPEHPLAGAFESPGLGAHERRVVQQSSRWRMLAVLAATLLDEPVDLTDPLTGGAFDLRQSHEAVLVRSRAPDREDPPLGVKASAPLEIRLRRPGASR